MSWPDHHKYYHLNITNNYPMRLSLTTSHILVFLAAGTLIVSFIIPSDGLGFSSCSFKTLSGVPCHGCGLTRSVASISHLELHSAFRYHPFGFIIYGLMLGALIWPVLGKESQQKLRDYKKKNTKTLNYLVWVTLGIFLLYGFARAILSVAGYVQHV